MVGSPKDISRLDSDRVPDHSSSDLTNPYAQIEQDREQTRAQLTISEERFRSLSICSPAGIFIATDEGEYVWSNPRLHQICGTSLESMLGQGWANSVHPEDRDRVVQEWRTATTAGVAVDHEYRMQPDSGVTRWVRVQSVPLRNERGETNGYMGTVEDITPQKQVLERLQRQTEQQILLNDILQSIRSSLEWPVVIERTTQALLRAYGVSRCFWLTCEMDYLYPVAIQMAPGISSVANQKVPIVNNPYAQTVLTQTDPIAVDDVETSPLIRPTLEFTQQRQVKSILAVSIYWEGCPIGMLVLEQCHQPHHWTHEEQLLLKQVADQLSVATQQALLYQEIQDLNTTLERQVEERTSQLQQALNAEATLKRILNKVRDSLDERQILQTAVDELGQGLREVETCNLALYDGDFTQSTICYEYPPDHPYSSLGTTIDLPSSSEVYEQLRQGQTVHYSRVAQDNVWPHKYKRTQLAVPIQDLSDLLGDLWLIRPEGQFFTPAEISLVEQVAAQCAIAIRQARLYQSAQTQVQELAKLNQLKDDFLSTVSHELRTPLTNMRMAIKMLEVASSEEKRKRYLALLEQDFRREKDLIDDLLNLQRLDANRFDFTWESIDIHAIFPSLQDSFSERAQEAQIDFEMMIPEQTCSWISDRTCVERILQELLNNACKYTPSQGQIRLVLELRSQQIIFTVGNTATIPEEELPKIFDKFYRSVSTNPRRQTGTGLGLPLIKKLVEQMQGEITVTSESGWTQFTVVLPRTAPEDPSSIVV